MTRDDQDEVQLATEVPREYKTRLKRGDDTIKDQLLDALSMYFGEAEPESRAAIERNLQRFREQKAKGEQMVADGETMIHEADEAIENLESRLEDAETTDDDYAADLDDVIAQMRDAPMAVFPGHASITRIANTHGKSEQAVIDDIRERTDLDASHFGRGRPDTENDSDGPSVLQGGDD